MSKVICFTELDFDHPMHEVILTHTTSYKSTETREFAGWFGGGLDMRNRFLNCYLCIATPRDLTWLW